MRVCAESSGAEVAVQAYVMTESIPGMTSFWASQDGHNLVIIIADEIKNSEQTIFESVSPLYINKRNAPPA